jgi:hypothetical protein
LKLYFTGSDFTPADTYRLNLFLVAGNLDRINARHQIFKGDRQMLTFG